MSGWKRGFTTGLTFLVFGLLFMEGAFAVDYTVNEAWCISAAVGGTWSTSPDTCEHYGITILSTDTLTIPVGVTLYTYDDEIYNYGTITNHGHLWNEDYDTDNYGTINN